MPPADTLPVGWRGEGRHRSPLHLPLPTIHRHALVTGTTGYGKTGFLLSVILGLLTGGTRTGIVVVDPKGETVELLREWFLPALAERLPGLVPERIATVAPFGHWGARLNPCSRIPGLPLEVQAHHVGQLLAGLVDGMGPRMASALGWVLRAVIEAGGSLLDVRAALVEEVAAKALATRVRDEEVRDYLLRTLPRESQATKDALRARIEHLLLLPALKAMLCAEGSVSGADLIESPVTLVDLSGSPMGMASTAQFVGGWVFTMLAAAALTRPVTVATHPVLLVIDEWHRVAVSASDDLERLLSQVRHRKVGLWLANQTLGQVSALSTSLVQSLITNVSVQALFRPKPEDLKDLDDLLPVTGRKVDPSLPDRLLTAEEERRRYKSALSLLPPRQALLVDRVSGTAEVMSTLTLPFDEARRRAEALPESTLAAWRKGRFGVPIEDLLCEARRRVSVPPTPTPAPSPAPPPVRPAVTPEVRRRAAEPEPMVTPAASEPVVTPAAFEPEPVSPPKKGRGGRERLRLVVPS